MRLAIALALLALLLNSCLPALHDVETNPADLLPRLLTSSSLPAASGFHVGGQIFGDSPVGLALNFSGTGCGPAQSSSPVAAGAYQFAGIPDGCTAATVTVAAQPPSAFCQIYNSTGLAVSGADVTTVDLYCFSVQLPPGPLHVYEDGSIIVNTRLSSSPGPSPVTIAYASDNGGITTTASLTFSSGDFSIDQPLTLGNPTDGNLLGESATITASLAGHAIKDVAVNSIDTTGASSSRFIYVTAANHNGNFAGDGSLPGSDWVQKADSYCSLATNRPAALLSTGNYRAVLTDGTLRSSQIGSQVGWPVRGTINYYAYDGTIFATATVDNVLPVPVTNLLSGGGDYWTGIGETTTWSPGVHCSSWSIGTNATSAHFGVGSANNSQLFAFTNFTCDQTKQLLCVQDLRDRGDGTISSAHQDRLWMKCESGQTWTGGSCTGSVASYAFCSPADNTCNGGADNGTLTGFGSSSLHAYCNGLALAGRIWRVPTVPELQELFRATRPDPSLFPGLSTMTYYYSNQSVTLDRAQGVLFAGGTTGSLIKTTPYRVRCVSNGM